MTEQRAEQEKILFVDDDTHILDAFRRNFRKTFNMETATSAREAAQIIARKGPFAVVVSDMRMPGVDGVQFLNRLREITPDTVRIMLTGYADVQSSIAAVNEGNVFRFLTKPCPAHQMQKTLEDALRQYRLVIAEKQLLEQTLSGSIKVLTELLALVNPEAFGRANRIHRHVRQMAFHLGMTNTWEIENAALLSQVGCMLLPAEAIQKLTKGQDLSGEEQQVYDMHPMIASDLLGHIPRLETVREMIAYQEKHYDGQGAPAGGKAAAEIPLGGRILKVLVDFDQLESSGKSTSEALKIMHGRKGWYDPKILQTLAKVLVRQSGFEVRDVFMEEMKSEMVLAENVHSIKGVLLVAKGQSVTPVLLTKLRTFAGIGGVREPIKVLVPPESEADLESSPEAD